MRNNSRSLGKLTNAIKVLMPKSFKTSAHPSRGSRMELVASPSPSSSARSVPPAAVPLSRHRACSRRLTAFATVYHNIIGLEQLLYSLSCSAISLSRFASGDPSVREESLPAWLGKNDTYTYKNVLMIYIEFQVSQLTFVVVLLYLSENYLWYTQLH